MAGKKKASKRRPAAEVEEEETPETEEDEEVEEEEDEEEENNDPQRRELTGKEKKKLFLDYQEAVDTLAEIDEARASAKEELSVKVKEIFDNIGSGPFLWKGAQLKIATRKDNYFMRVQSAAPEEIGDD